jgi:hypothetical protein
MQLYIDRQSSVHQLSATECSLETAEVFVSTRPSYSLDKIAAIVFMQRLSFLANQLLEMQWYRMTPGFSIGLEAGLGCVSIFLSLEAGRKTLETSINALRSLTACLQGSLFKDPFPDSPKRRRPAPKRVAKPCFSHLIKAASKINSRSHRVQNIKLELSNWLEMWTDPVFSRYWMFILLLCLYHSERFGYKNSNKS